VADAA
jgi:hypothetical protein